MPLDHHAGESRYPGLRKDVFWTPFFNGLTTLQEFV